jgi:trk system potassium uptake protein TrkH
MLSHLKLSRTFSGLPLLFQIFGLACILMIAIAAYALVSDMFREARIFFYVGLTGILILSLVILGTSNRNMKETGVLQLFSLILSFLVLPLFLAFPTWIILPNLNWLDAYLDMVGAFTTTGLPVFEKELFSQPIHLWRALVAWFGGGLIWIAAFVILMPVNLGGFEVFPNKKNSSNSSRKLTLDERSTTLIRVSQKFVPVYLCLTITLWGCLTSFGTDGYTSFIRALSVVSTSGISGPEKFELDGAGFFGELAIVIFLFFALSNNILKSFFKQIRLKDILYDKELRLGLSIVIAFTLLFSFKQLTHSNFHAGTNETFGSVIELIWGNFFTIFSFITTNGYVSGFWHFSSSPIDLSYTVIILMGLCLFGGGVATTAGGIKLLRISILFKAFSNETGKLLHPSSVTLKNSHMKNLEISVFMAWIFFMLFMVSVAILTIFLAVFEMPFEEALLLAVACLSTTGPIIEIAGLDKLLITELSVFSKMALIVGMVLGRLEILVALSLVTFGFNRI